MIDWIKLEVSQEAEKDLLHLNFINPVNIDTGEIMGNCRVAYLKYNGSLKLQLFASGRIWISGSLHKYWHGNNYTDFLYDDIKKTIDQICSALSINPKHCKILQMEYGLNLRTPFKSKELLKRVICTKYRAFSLMQVKRGLGLYCTFTDWVFKIYDKGKQYHLPNEILRVEKKVTNSRLLKMKGIKVLSDLSKHALEVLGHDLLEMLDTLIINDCSIDESALTPNQLIALAKYRNPLFWETADKYKCRDSNERFKNFAVNFGKETYLDTIKDLSRLKVFEIIQNPPLQRKSPKINVYIPLQ